MKKNVHFAALFPLNLALITNNAPSSVNPSILIFTPREHPNFHRGLNKRYQKIRTVFQYTCIMHDKHFELIYRHSTINEMGLPDDSVLGTQKL